MPSKMPKVPHSRHCPFYTLQKIHFEFSPWVERWHTPNSGDDGKEIQKSSFLHSFQPVLTLVPTPFSTHSRVPGLAILWDSAIVGLVLGFSHSQSSSQLAQIHWVRHMPPSASQLLKFCFHPILSTLGLPPSPFPPSLPLPIPLSLTISLLMVTLLKGFPSGSGGKESVYNAGDLSSILGSGRSPGEGNGYPL